MNQIKINLGCGEKYIDGYINCDILSSVKAEKVFDLNVFPYPFSANYADEVLMDMVLEHVESVVKVIEEVYRIVKNKGIVRIYVPYAKSEWAVQDPTHIHAFNEKSMDYFVSDYRYNYYTKVRFKKRKAELYISSETMLSSVRKFIPFRNVLTKFLCNMYDGIYFELEAIKE